MKTEEEVQVEEVQDGKQKLRKRMKAQIKSLNNVITDTYLEDKDDEFLLCLCHPTDREWFRSKLELDVPSKRAAKIKQPIIEL